MNQRLILLSTSGLCLLLASPLAAQEVDFENDPNTIVVTGSRIAGQVVTDQPPVLELDEADIAAFGASSIEDLVEAVSSQATSSRGRGEGRPVFLVNGIRINGFREMRSYPPEAIRKVEVLPEEVAQRFGFPADRRVMNFILKDDFSSREIEVEYEQPGKGGYSRTEQEATLLKIANGNRFNINLELEDVSPLTEGERGVIQSDPASEGEPDPADYRTLVADSMAAEATVNWARADLESGSSLSANATWEHDQQRTLSGLSLFDTLDPIEGVTNTDTFSTSLTNQRPVGSFQLSASADYTHSDSNGEYDRRDEAGSDTTSTKIDTVVTKATLSGTPLLLPAGDVATTFDLGFDWKRYDSDDTRSAEPVELIRRRVTAGANVVVPIAERGGAWGAIGDLTASFRIGVEDLSDFGTIGDYSAGLTWGVTDTLTLTATHIGTEAAPSLTQLGSPLIQTFNVPVYDFTTGETTLATITTGGNSELVAETQRDWKLSANWETPLDNTRLSVDYIRNRSRNVSSDFPVLTADIEAAFPDRVTRNDDGELLAIDRRPVTFARSSADRLVLGLTRRGEWGKSSAEALKGRERQRGGMPGFGRDNKGRYFINLNHTIELKNTVLIAEGVPLLDLLDGDATSGYGLSRHSSSLEFGMFKSGQGVRVSGSYTGPSTIVGGSADPTSALRFGSLATFDIRFFGDLGKLIGKEDGIFEKTRIAFKIDNVLDGRRKVTDGNGDTPLSYQPYLVDPTGRYFGIDIRKMF